jgi:Spy/CpxP family protein refolding chaperone
MRSMRGWRLTAPILAVGFALACAVSAAAQQTSIPPLPEGEGRDLVQFHCSICHDLTLVRQQRLSRPVWNRILDDMKKNGAVFSEEQRQVILDYLAKHLGP